MPKGEGNTGEIESGRIRVNRLNQLNAENALLKELLQQQTAELNELRGKKKEKIEDVVEQVKEAKAKRPPPLHALLVELIDEWKGPREVAKAMKTTFDKGAPGIQAGIMKTILRLIDLNTQQGGATEDLLDWSDEELKRELAQLVNAV